MIRKDRLARIQEKLDKRGIPQMLITDPYAIYYLTGYLTDPKERFLGLYVRKQQEPILFLNKLFFLTEDIDVRKVWYSDTYPVMDLVAEYVAPGEILGVDKAVPAGFLLPLMDKAKASGYVLASDCVDGTREIKDEDEIARMVEASRINDLAMGKLKDLIRPGVTEREIAEQIDGIYRELGAEGNAFTPIVAFGENGADGHHVPDGTILKEGQSVIFDVGCLKDSYCADMTRTFFYGKVSDKHREIYELVRRANETAEAAIRPGRKICEIDRAARDVIAEAGYGEQFNHRLGHFIGMEVHEKGDVSAVNEALLKPGMIFSVEPGVYLPGEVGVRIEDLVVVTEDGCRRLNTYTKELQVIEA